jgi:hypothetical protein
MEIFRKDLPENARKLRGLSGVWMNVKSKDELFLKKKTIQ